MTFSFTVTWAVTVRRAPVTATAIVTRVVNVNVGANVAVWSIVTLAAAIRTLSGASVGEVSGKTSGGLLASCFCQR